MFVAIDDGLHSDATHKHSKLTVNNNNNDIILDKNQIVNKLLSTHSTAPQTNGTPNGKQSGTPTMTTTTKPTKTTTIHEQPIDNFANFDDFPAPKSNFNANETDFFAEFNDNFANSKVSTVDRNDAFGEFGLNSTRIDDDGIGDRFNQRNNANLTSSTIKLTNRLNSDDKFASSFVTTNSCVDKQNNVIIGGNKLDAFGFDDGEFADFNSAFDALNYQPDIKPLSTTATTYTTNAVNKLKSIQNTDFTTFSNEKFGNGAIDTTDAIKPPTKFASDYSKSDAFEDDLQKVLQRSLVDQ